MVSTSNPSSMEPLNSRSIIFTVQVKTVYNLKFPREINNREYSNLYSIFCAGSVGGWLIMTEFSRPYVWRNYFFNLMTGAQFMLPPHGGRNSMGLHGLFRSKLFGLHSGNNYI